MGDSAVIYRVETETNGSFAGAFFIGTSAMHNSPVIHAMIATFLALGEAVGERTLQRAGNLIRNLIADDVVSPETADILESVLVGIDYDDSDPDENETTEYERLPFAWFADLTQSAQAA